MSRCWSRSSLVSRIGSVRSVSRLLVKRSRLVSGYLKEGKLKPISIHSLPSSMMCMTLLSMNIDPPNAM